jgi:hypothetical protein
MKKLGKWHAWAESLPATCRLGEGYFGYLAAVLGHKVEAREIVEKLESGREKGYVPALPIVWTYLGLGETAEALHWLQTALAERDPFLGSLMVFPAYEPIRDHPEFRRLARELRFPAQ